MDIEHKARLHSLYLWDGTELTWAWMRVFSGEKTLNVLNWFMVWWWVASGSLVVIGWWTGNTIDWRNSGIGWWSSNTIISDNSAIGWWSSNNTNWIYGVVVWWFSNTAGEKGVVLWGQGNNASNWWVVLWGRNNRSSWDGSLSLWSYSQSAGWLFLWNWTSSSTSSNNISSISWVWIGSLGSINTLSGVYLYVDWPVGIENSNLSTEWEVMLSSIGCIRWYDGNYYRTFWRASWASTSPCWWNDGICQFGWVLVQNGEKVKAYRKPYSTNCNSNYKTYTCDNWTFKDSGWNGMWEYVYPYCYDITATTRYQWS